MAINFCGYFVVIHFRSRGFCSIFILRPLRNKGITMAAGSTYSTIATTTLGTAQSSVTFNSFSGYTDIIVVCNLAISSGTGNSKIQFNSDTGSNYSGTTVEGTGSSAVSSRYTSNTSIILEGSGYLSTTFQTVKIIHLV